MEKDTSKISSQRSSHQSYGSPSRLNLTANSLQQAELIKSANKKKEMSKKITESNNYMMRNLQDYSCKTDNLKNLIQDAADILDDQHKKDLKVLWNTIGISKINEGTKSSQGKKTKGKTSTLDQIKTQCKKKQGGLEQDRDELARICQMLIDELLECEGRVKAAEAVIGDFQRNQRMKDSLLQEIEDLQDKSKNLDSTMLHQAKEIEKLENFINSENGLNQKRVSDLEDELATDERTAHHLLQVIEELKAKVDLEEVNVLQKDIELNKKVEDLHDLNIKLTEGSMDFKQTKKAVKIKV